MRQTDLRGQSPSLCGPTSKGHWINMGCLREATDKKYADDGMVIGVRRSLIKLTQAWNETPGVLGTRTTKLSTLAFFEEVKEKSHHSGPVADLII